MTTRQFHIGRFDIDERVTLNGVVLASPSDDD